MRMFHNDIGVVGWDEGARLTSSTVCPTNLDNSRARVGGCLDFFFSPLSFLSSFSLCLRDSPC